MRTRDGQRWRTWRRCLGLNGAGIGPRSAAILTTFRCEASYKVSLRLNRFCLRKALRPYGNWYEISSIGSYSLRMFAQGREALYRRRQTRQARFLFAMRNLGKIKGGVYGDETAMDRTDPNRRCAKTRQSQIYECNWRGVHACWVRSRYF